MTATADAVASDGRTEPAIVTPSLVYDGTVFHSAGSSLRRGITYSGNLNLRLYIDPPASTGLRDVVGYVDVLWIHGGQPSELTGDAQGVSNISAPPEVAVYEAWVQKNAFGDGLSLLAGLYDLNSEFYRLQTAGLFLNSSFGIGAEFAQSGVEGPSIFPRTSWGVRATWRPGDYASLQTAVVNGVPFERPDGSHAIHDAGDGVLALAEFSLVDRFRHGRQRHSQRFRLGRSAAQPAHDNKVAVGAWRYTAAFADQSERLADGAPLMRRGSRGYYAIGETLLYGGDGSTRRRLSGFVQAGRGDAKVDRFGAYGSAGLTATGLFRDAGDDELGMAINIARNGAHYLAAQQRARLATARLERTMEVSYLLPLGAALAVQPDLQFIHHPDTDPARADAVALQLRFEVTY